MSKINHAYECAKAWISIIEYERELKHKLGADIYAIYAGLGSLPSLEKPSLEKHVEDYKQRHSRLISGDKPPPIKPEFTIEDVQKYLTLV